MDVEKQFLGEIEIIVLVLIAGGVLRIGPLRFRLPTLGKILSRKQLLAMGIIAYGLRMFLFAYVEVFPLPPILTLILGVALHGFCFGCFIFVAFMVVDERSPSIKATLGSNTVHLTTRIDPRTGMVVSIATLDNLMKGASGMAIQNANLALGLPEASGLPVVGVYP